MKPSDVYDLLVNTLGYRICLMGDYLKKKRLKVLHVLRLRSSFGKELIVISLLCGKRVRSEKLAVSS